MPFGLIASIPLKIAADSFLNARKSIRRRAFGGIHKLSTPPLFFGFLTPICSLRNIIARTRSS